MKAYIEEGHDSHQAFKQQETNNHAISSSSCIRILQKPPYFFEYDEGASKDAVLRALDELALDG